MIQEIALNNALVIIVMYINNGLPTRSITILSGPVLPFVFFLQVKIGGKGGYINVCHSSTNLIRVVSFTILALQQLISREDVSLRQ